MSREELFKIRRARVMAGRWRSFKRVHATRGGDGDGG
jgi:hypothetical protein